MDAGGNRHSSNGEDFVTHPSKNKGNAFERELVNMATKSGMNAKRAYASNGESLGQSADVDLMIEGVKIQAKRRKAIASYLQIPSGCDAVAFRQDRAETLLLIRYSDFLDLLKEAGSWPTT